MPFAQIYMFDGRTDEQKKAVIEMVMAALDEAVGTPAENIRIWIHDKLKAQWGIADKTVDLYDITEETQGTLRQLSKKLEGILCATEHRQTL
jgi:4-oxalocrotonate tautomerase